MLQAGDGSVWVATGNGLHRCFQGAWGAVGTAEGLPSDVVHTVVEDGAHRVWAGTARGLSRHFPEADIDPPLTFEPKWEPVRDPASDTTLRFTFEGRDKWRFTPDQRLLYSYRVDEGEWSPFQADNHVVLPNLPSGRHRFEVRAMDRNWNIQLQTIATSFTVVLPWTKDPRILGIVSAAFLAVLVSLGFAVNRHLKLRRSYAEVERQVAERTAELKRATEALVQSQKMTALGTLAAGIAHDFNNLLSIIKGSAQIIAAQPDRREKVLARLRRIEAAVEQASGVVLAMLGFARAGERRPAACEVSAVVEETLRLLGDRFRRQIHLRRELEPDLPPVWAVRDLLQQMLLNLILNAADALGGRGEIRLTARRLPPGTYEWSLAPREAPAYVELAVRDAGAGIPPEIRPRIFEPFFSTKPLSRRHGTGLGLYMVYEFAREMGLGLRVESEPGRGAAFFIVLPVAPAAAHR
jgi:signal transduction histidine kinase